MVSHTKLRVQWAETHRIIRSRFPPIDLFEDIADPADWEAIASAEAKFNPRTRIADTIGNLALVPPARRIGGPGSSMVMAPFVHVSTDRPSRFSDGTFGIYYAGDSLEVAIYETAYHHARFMQRTNEAPGWTSDFRQLIGTLNTELVDLSANPAASTLLDPDSYTESQAYGLELRRENFDGIIYPSVRKRLGQCIAIFWPDICGVPSQADHFSYEWNGKGVSRVRNLTTKNLYAL
jgi:hypothetical protein